MSITVLIVDDEPSARLLVSDILSDDYDVVEAQDAKQAMEMFATHNPDIVLSDIKMPGEDGVALLGKIKSVSPKTPVILLTGHGDKVLAVEALKKGAFDFRAIHSACRLQARYPSHSLSRKKALKPF